MRLITFQDKAVLDVLSEGKWYSTRAHRMKAIDYDYCDEESNKYPIYTFASFGVRDRCCFGLYQFYTLLTHLAGFMRFDLNETVLVELEVPEDFVLNTKKVNVWFETECDETDPDKEVYKRVSVGKSKWFKRDLSQGDVYTSNYLQVVRENRDTELEAVIPYIDKSHVVALRSFDAPNGDYGDTTCKTVYVNESLCPLWYGTIHLNGDGYPRFDETEDADIISLCDKLKAEGKYVVKSVLAQNKYGAKQVPEYFTLQEALACGNDQLTSKIRSVCEAKGLSNDDCVRITVGESLKEKAAYKFSRLLDVPVASFLECKTQEAFVELVERYCR